MGSEAEHDFESGFEHGRKVSHFLVDVTSHGRETLSHALAIAFTRLVQGQLQATHYLFQREAQLTFFSFKPSSPWATDASEFEVAINAEEAVEFAWNWLESVSYPSDENIDGGSVPGWRAFNEKYGIVGGEWNALVAIRPTWIYLSK